VLTVQGLMTSYGGIDALRGVDISVAKGSVTALIGANGAGKTTFINSVTGVVRPRAGSISFEGKELSRLPAHRVSRLGLIQVPEGRRILAPFTVRENLELGWQALGARGAPSKDDLARVYELFPRLAERERQLAGSLSGGEQQMLAIGRALMARPKLLMLDEPSLGLAPLLVKEIFAFIKRINEEMGLTVLVIEQNARRALEVADHGYILEQGRIVLEGPAQELQENPDVKEFYLGLGDSGSRKSFRDVKHYKRRKRWL
jgi:branched-chain amino acid transport system ATP-binding protein